MTILRHAASACTSVTTPMPAVRRGSAPRLRREVICGSRLLFWFEPATIAFASSGTHPASSSPSDQHAKHAPLAGLSGCHFACSADGTLVDMRGARWRQERYLRQLYAAADQPARTRGPLQSHFTTETQRRRENQAETQGCMDDLLNDRPVDPLCASVSLWLIPRNFRCQPIELPLTVAAILILVGDSYEDLELWYHQAAVN